MSRCCQSLVLSRKRQSAGQRVMVWWIGRKHLTSEQLAGVHGLSPNGLAFQTESLDLNVKAPGAPHRRSDSQFAPLHVTPQSRPTARALPHIA